MKKLQFALIVPILISIISCGSTPVTENNKPGTKDSQTSITGTANEKAEAVNNSSKTSGLETPDSVITVEGTSTLEKDNSTAVKQEEKSPEIENSTDSVNDVENNKNKDESKENPEESSGKSTDGISTEENEEKTSGKDPSIETAASDSAYPENSKGAPVQEEELPDGIYYVNKQTGKKLQIDDWKYMGFGTEIPFWVIPALEENKEQLELLFAEKLGKNCQIELLKTEGCNHDQAENAINELEEPAGFTKYENFWVRVSPVEKDENCQEKKYISIAVFYKLIES